MPSNNNKTTELLQADPNPEERLRPKPKARQRRWRGAAALGMAALLAGAATAGLSRAPKTSASNALAPYRGNATALALYRGNAPARPRRADGQKRGKSTALVPVDGGALRRVQNSMNSTYSGRVAPALATADNFRQYEAYLRSSRSKDLRALVEAPAEAPSRKQKPSSPGGAGWWGAGAAATGAITGAIGQALASWRTKRRLLANQQTRERQTNEQAKKIQNLENRLKRRLKATRGRAAATTVRELRRVKRLKRELLARIQKLKRGANPNPNQAGSTGTGPAATPTKVPAPPPAPPPPPPKRGQQAATPPTGPAATPPTGPAATPPTGPAATPLVTSLQNFKTRLRTLLPPPRRFPVKPKDKPDPALNFIRTRLEELARSGKVDKNRKSSIEKLLPKKNLFLPLLLRRVRDANSVRTFVEAILETLRRPDFDSYERKNGKMRLKQAEAVFVKSLYDMGEQLANFLKIKGYDANKEFQALANATNSARAETVNRARNTVASINRALDEQFGRVRGAMRNLFAALRATFVEYVKSIGPSNDSNLTRLEQVDRFIAKVSLSSQQPYERITLERTRELIAMIESHLSDLKKRERFRRQLRVFGLLMEYIPALQQAHEEVGKEEALLRKVKNENKPMFPTLGELAPMPGVPRLARGPLDLASKLAAKDKITTTEYEAATDRIAADLKSLSDFTQEVAVLTRAGIDPTGRRITEK